MAEGVDSMASLAEGPKSLSPKDRKPFLQRTGTKIALAGSAAVLAGAGIGAKMGFFERGESPAQVSIATVPATVVPTEGPQLATPMPSPTPEVTQAPATVPTSEANPDAKAPPVEAEQEIPCLILAPELCSQAERVPIIIEGKEYIYLGFKDLPPGTPVYFPNDGFFSVDEESGPQFSGFNIFVRKATGGGTEIRGVLDVDNIIQRDVEAGEIAGHTLDGKTLEGKYSLLVTITKRSPEGPVTDEDALRQMAPLAFEKPLAGSTQNIEDSGSSATFKLPPGAEPAR